MSSENSINLTGVLVKTHIATQLIMDKWPFSDVSVPGSPTVAINRLAAAAAAAAELLAEHGLLGESAILRPEILLSHFLPFARLETKGLASALPRPKLDPTTGQEGFPCPVCHKVFRLHSVMTRHKKIHSGKAEYVCDLCGKAFGRSDTLLEHKRGVHKIYNS
ncbi:zinc finger protein-like [Tropilaelaps mercedesae]|uniref:Zinc finger protein-like n=1 Tax=Tropilaelaps mercedesae TaxID=418985 RepID=A0A1V9XEX8_9ACAR|nr:zinc finger protein-like [Tropilaelaps mercedesae]